MKQIVSDIHIYFSLLKDRTVCIHLRTLKPEELRKQLRNSQQLSETAVALLEEQAASVAA